MDDKTKKEIHDTYHNGAWSPLQLSYKFKVEIEEVYEAIGDPAMNEVTLVGDQIDADDAGPGAVINRGSKQKARYSKN